MISAPRLTATPPLVGILRGLSTRAMSAGGLLILAVILAGCSGDDPTVEGTTVSGVVVDVQGDLTGLEQFDLVLEDGTRLTFTPEAGALERSGFSPAHIREHSALVEPISVTYREEDGQNIAIGVGDAES